MEEEEGGSGGGDGVWPDSGLHGGGGWLTDLCIFQSIGGKIPVGTPSELLFQHPHPTQKIGTATGWCTRNSVHRIQISCGQRNSKPSK